jgi:hypothetical protein
MAAMHKKRVKFADGDDENPRAWSGRKKVANVSIIALMTILGPLAGSMPTPGIEPSAILGDVWEAKGLHLHIRRLYLALGSYRAGAECGRAGCREDYWGFFRSVFDSLAVELCICTNDSLTRR